MKKTLKKTIILLLAALMIISCVGCGENNGEKTGETTENPLETQENPADDKIAKRIVFTFDDGPQAPPEDLEEGYYPYTEYLLDRIENLGARVTFFVLGNRAEQYPNAIKRAVSLGCEIGSHTYSHPQDVSFNKLSDEKFNSEITKAENAIKAVTGVKPNLFRPVGGAVSESQLQKLADMGYTSVAWSIDTNDWDGKFSRYKAEKNPEDFERFVEEKVNIILNQAYDGGIILMHDISMSSVEIFDRAAKKLMDEGYKLVTVGELLGDKVNNPSAVIYLDNNDYQTSRG